MYHLSVLGSITSFMTLRNPDNQTTLWWQNIAIIIESGGMSMTLGHLSLTLLTTLLRIRMYFPSIMGLVTGLILTWLLESLMDSIFGLVCHTCKPLIYWCINEESGKFSLTRKWFRNGYQKVANEYLSCKSYLHPFKTTFKYISISLTISLTNVTILITHDVLILLRCQEMNFGIKPKGHHNRSY